VRELDPIGSKPLAKRPRRVYNTDKKQNHSKMIHYIVRCPSDPYENTQTYDLDRAYDLCLGLSEDYGYAEIGYYNVKGFYQLIADYTNGQ